MASGNYSFEQMFQRSRNLESQLDLLLEILDEGVIGVNEKGKIFACNQKARVITGMKIRMLLGRPAEQIFPYIPFEKCIREQTQVLERLIRINAANINMTSGSGYDGAAGMYRRFFHPSAIKRAGKKAK